MEEGTKVFNCLKQCSECGKDIFVASFWPDKTKPRPIIRDCNCESLEDLSKFAGEKVNDF